MVGLDTRPQKMVGACLPAVVVQLFEIVLGIFDFFFEHSRILNSIHSKNKKLWSYEPALTATLLLKRARCF